MSKDDNYDHVSGRLRYYVKGHTTEVKVNMVSDYSATKVVKQPGEPPVCLRKDGKQVVLKAVEGSFFAQGKRERIVVLKCDDFRTLVHVQLIKTFVNEFRWMLLLTGTGRGKEDAYFSIVARDGSAFDTKIVVNTILDESVGFTLVSKNRMNEGVSIVKYHLPTDLDVTWHEKESACKLWTPTLVKKWSGNIGVMVTTATGNIDCFTRQIDIITRDRHDATAFEQSIESSHRNLNAMKVDLLRPDPICVETRTPSVMRLPAVTRSVTPASEQGDEHLEIENITQQSTQRHLQKSDHAAGVISWEEGWPLVVPSPVQTKASIHARLHLAWMLSGKKVAAIADFVGHDAPTVHKWVNGTKPVPAPFQKQMAKCLAVHPDWLINGDRAHVPEWLASLQAVRDGLDSAHAWAQRNGIAVPIWGSTSPVPGTEYETQRSPKKTWDAYAPELESPTNWTKRFREMVVDAIRKDTGDRLFIPTAAPPIRCLFTPMLRALPYVKFVWNDPTWGCFHVPEHRSPPSSGGVHAQRDPTQ